jgi:hypothetical protein
VTDQLQQNRYDRLLRRVGGIIGPGSKVSEVLSELFPVIDVERVPGELMLLMGTRLGFGGGAVSATAAEAGRGQILNPAGSGHIVTVTTAIASAAGVGNIRWGFRQSGFLTQIDTQLARDTRVPGASNTVATIHQDSSVALASATGQSRAIPSTAFILTDPNGVCVLAPGTAFEIGSDQLNVFFNYTFYWRERPMTSSEVITG